MAAVLHLAQGQVATLAGTDTNCTFSLRHGLKRDGSGRPTLRLAYNDGVLEASPTTPAAQRVGFERQPRLCWLDRDQTSTKPVLLMVANSLPYVWREWPYLTNKVAFSREVGWNAVLWLGELPKDLATTVGPWCCSTAVGARLKLLAKNFGRKKVNCSGTRRLAAYKGVGHSSYAGSQSNEINSNHHAKMAAASLLLRDDRVRDVSLSSAKSQIMAIDAICPQVLPRSGLIRVRHHRAAQHHLGRRRHVRRLLRRV